MNRPRYLMDEDVRGSILRAVRHMEPSLEIRSVVEEGLSAVEDKEILELTRGSIPGSCCPTT